MESTGIWASSIDLSTHVPVSEPTVVLDSITEADPLLVQASEPTAVYDSATERTSNLLRVSDLTGTFDSMTVAVAMLDSATETPAMLDSATETPAMLDSAIKTAETTAASVSVSATPVLLGSSTETTDIIDSFVLRSITSTNETTHVSASHLLTNTSFQDTVYSNTGNATVDGDRPPPMEWAEDELVLVDGPKTSYTLAYQVEACGRHCRNGTIVWSAPPRNSPFSCSRCYCDNLCTSYGDCCPDENGTVPSRDLDVGYVCMRPGRFTTTMYYMIKRCPFSVTSVVNDELYPVTSVRTLQTYFNQAFAACNNDTDVIHWLNDTTCSGIDGNETTTRETTQGRGVSECHVTFTPAPETVTHRQCSWHKTVAADRIVDKCNSSGILAYVDPVLDTLCQSSEYLVDSYGTVYKNVFCSLCNTISLIPPGFADDMQDAPISLGVLTSFTVRGGNQDEEAEKVTCAENEWSDPVTKRCREIKCVPGRYLEGENCALDDTDILHTEYYNVMKFTFTKNIFDVKNWTDVMTMVRNSMPEMLSKFDVLVYSFRVEELVYPDSDPGVETDYNVGIHIEFRSERNGSRSEYESYVFNITWGEWVFQYNGAVTVLQPERYDYSADRDDWHIFTFDPLAKTCCSDEPYGTWLYRLSELFSWFPLNPEVMVPLHSLLCPYVILDEEEFTISPNGSLLLFSGNATLRKEEYFQDYFEIQVCLDTLRLALNDYNDTEAYIMEDNMSHVQGYLSLVCTCISLICLLLTLITFFKFSALRSLPNKNTMLLSMSLFAAQGTFQFGAGRTGNKMACQIIGVAIHFLWLTVVFWMNVCCYHMFRVFASSAKGRIAHSIHWKTLMKYALYVYGSASAIVAATIGANYAISHGTSTGYGERLCYINDPKVNGLAFVLPLGITIVVNTVLFSYSIYTISKISKIETTSSLDRRNMFVYIKLSTLTGVFWGLAILAEVTAISALSYISVVLNGSQGAFIFISYVANRRVYRMWRKVCRHADYTGSRSSQYTESSRF
ncbi:uncharacterized protein LOC124263834 [Haliotis rubra]|uniref:uncharacterized protein LOC124263834 n=1 Tax=Haliotis rubra TaxID=36100 RepID=UPI001EE557AA|nr:uncharacterized protein LOC124263834 [Haliotis rubra]